ncbi:MAG TPA: putative Ig domain-containing protein [Terriglobia bacterium]|nr:putative Ig domain-containing protein [Terriglobia bacterium]
MSRFKLSIACLAMVLIMASQAFAATPTISSISPTAIPAGYPSFTLTVNGANFAPPVAVYWNASPLALTYASATQLRAMVPNTLFTTSGSVAISVICAGVKSNAVGFAILPPPATPSTSTAPSSGSGTTTTAAGPLAISSTSIPGGFAGTAYSASLAASGGTGPYTWSVSSGALPPGLALSAAGTISGTPTTSGTYSFVGTVKDSVSQSATYTYSTSIATATTTSVASGSASGSPTGSTTPSTSTAAPPPATSTATSTSTPPPTTTTATTTVATTPVAISTSSIPTGTTGTGYGVALTALGGTSPYSWAVVSGALPAGLTLSTSGMIFGTPTTSGSYTFTAQVKDSTSHLATYTYSISIATGTTSTATTTTTTTATPTSTSTTTPTTTAMASGSSALTISTNSLASGIVGTAYSATLAATGGTSPYTWSVIIGGPSGAPSSGGALPPGLTMSSSGVISGTVTTAGTYSFTAQVKDSTNSLATATYTFSFN